MGQRQVQLTLHNPREKQRHQNATGNDKNI